MSAKLWTSQFWRISFSNFFLFASLFTLLPQLAPLMGERLGTLSVGEMQAVYLFFGVGVLLIGPFHAYLVDAYRRKYVYLFSLVLMMASTGGMAFVENFPELLMLSVVYGLSFGLAATAGITLAIDITNSTLRSQGNICFAWAALWGIVVGGTLGAFLWGFLVHHPYWLLYASGVWGVLCGLSTLRIYVPFRAPLVTQAISLDRFFLPRAWVPALGMLPITFVVGLWVALSFPLAERSDGSMFVFPVFGLAGVGLVGAYVVRSLRLVQTHVYSTILVGLVLLVVGAFAFRLTQQNFTSVTLMGLGLGLALPGLWLVFVKLSRHCQRGTANTACLIASLAGFLLGLTQMWRAYFLNNDMECVGTREVLSYVEGATLVATLVALAFFACFTYPYYKRYKVR
ncbi:MAG: MFS transporter [Mediterranea sp.]|jgi:MFS family permease|nr:MFS transporter [Mediterranea sp.]